MTVAEVVRKMVEYSKGDLHDINHFMKVYAYAKTIAEGENLSPEQQKLVEVTAVVHDIACPLCRVKYGNANGKHQEEESAALIEEFFADSDLPKEFVDRVSYIVSHHHTITGIDGIDYQIMIEADYLVNADESNFSGNNVRNMLEKVFKTETVIIHCYHKLSFYMCKSAQKCRMLSEVTGHLYDPYPVILFSEFRHDLIRSVL